MRLDDAINIPRPIKEIIIHSQIEICFLSINIIFCIGAMNVWYMCSRILLMINSLGSCAARQEIRMFVKHTFRKLQEWKIKLCI